MNNFFTHEAIATRIMYGIPVMLNKDRGENTLKIISTNRRTWPSCSMCSKFMKVSGYIEKLSRFS